MSFISQSTRALFLSLLIGTAIASTAGATKPEINKQLHSAILRVRHAKTANAKYDAVTHIAMITEDIDSSRVSDVTISELISLLDEPEDFVRMWVAVSLGDIGPRASASVPKLLKILDEVECEIRDQSSEATIPIALKRMNVTPPPPKHCFH
jgi:HEAT repeat protein